MNPSPFDALLDDLAAVQERRNTQAPQRDTVSRSARRSRSVCATAARRLAKSAPLPDYRAPDWDSLSARQEQIAAGMEQSRQQAQRDAIRAHLATLAAAAKAGRLTAHQICLLDVYTGQAAALGLTP